MLDTKVIDELKNSLLAEKKRLEDNLNKIAHKEGGDYETNFDDIGRSQEENASEVEEYTDNLGVTETLEKNLEEVNAALARIENGSYGKCENCEGEIPVERLRAYPSARICIDCSKKSQAE